MVVLEEEFESAVGGGVRLRSLTVGALLTAHLKL